MVVVFTDDTTDKHSLSATEIRAIDEAARLFGYRVFTIPSNFEECGTAENALAYVPHFDIPTVAVWNGFIPTNERYNAIYKAASQKNIQLVNSPQEHRLAMQFDQFYPHLHDLTPKSVIVEDIAQLANIHNELDFPVFVKGAVKSDKEDGWQAVVAYNMRELNKIAERLFNRDYRSRGKVIIRELVKLKPIAISAKGFPISREYRAFFYKGHLLAYGFYWDDYQDPHGTSNDVKREILRLGTEVSKRLDVPFIAVDVGQLESGEWIVIEVGDGQFTGLSQIPILELWSNIKDFTL